jgi:acyl-CoA dehydrogenase
MRERLRAFVDERVIPREREIDAAPASVDGPYPPALRELRTEARAAGLWNLSIDRRHSGELSAVEYAPLCIEIGRSVAAPAVFNCAPPDSGNIDILLTQGDERQRAELLEPLLAGETRSAFSMTEPDTAGSDPAGLRTRAIREGDGWRIEGRKWFTTGALGAAFLIVVAVTDPDVHPRRRTSLFVVPADSPGLDIGRQIPILGHHGFPGHFEVTYDGVVVGPEALLGELGAGFAIAQERLRPGRLHHCLRGIGHAERALELLCARARTREIRGRTLAQHETVGDLVAVSRIEIEQCRLLTLDAVARLEVDPTGADVHISMAKVAVPEMCQRVIDRAVQVHGAMGVSDDVPLAALARDARTLRIVDGVDEVHRRVVARAELAA